LLDRKLRGALLALRVLGPRIVAREAVRRLIGLGYSYKGIRITSSEDFWILSAIAAKYKFYNEGGYVYVETPWALLRVPSNKFRLLTIMCEQVEEMYNQLDVENKVVIDIGAYIGETTLYFLSRGAKQVHAYEPVSEYYNILLDNIRLNNAENKVKAFNEGAWHREGRIIITESLTASGLDPQKGRSITIRVRSLASIIDYVASQGETVVKMDCEGCEYSILATPCKTLQKARQYLIEIHGAPTPIIDYMMQCGFKPIYLGTVAEGLISITLWLFNI